METEALQDACAVGVPSALRQQQSQLTNQEVVELSDSGEEHPSGVACQREVEVTTANQEVVELSDSEEHPSGVVCQREVEVTTASQQTDISELEVACDVSRCTPQAADEYIHALELSKQTVDLALKKPSPKRQRDGSGAGVGIAGGNRRSVVDATFSTPERRSVAGVSVARAGPSGLHWGRASVTIDDVNVGACKQPTPRELFSAWCRERTFVESAPVGAGLSLRELFHDGKHIAHGGGEFVMVARRVAILAAETHGAVTALAREHHTAGAAEQGSELFVPEQAYALQVWKAGRPVFLLGPPGSGKTKTTYDCLKDKSPKRNALLGNTWQQVNLYKNGLLRVGASAFAAEGVVTRAAGFHTGFTGDPRAAVQIRSLTYNARKVLSGDSVWLEEYFQYPMGITEFAQDMAGLVRGGRGFGSLQVGASGGVDQTLPIQSPAVEDEARRFGARPRYELPIEDLVLLNLKGLALIPFVTILRQRGPLADAVKEWGLGVVSEAGWAVVQQMLQNPICEDAVWLHAWNSLARDGDERDGLAYAARTGAAHIHHICSAAEKLREDDLRSVEERYYYHRQVFAVGRLVLITVTERKAYLQFKDGAYAHHNQVGTVVAILDGTVVQVRCPGRPENDAMLRLPCDRRRVYVTSLKENIWISGYSAKPYYHQTGANNQGNQHRAVVVDMVGMDKPGLLSMVLSRGTVCVGFGMICMCILSETDLALLLWFAGSGTHGHCEHARTRRGGAATVLQQDDGGASKGGDPACSSWRGH